MGQADVADRVRVLLDADLDQTVGGLLQHVRACVCPPSTDCWKNVYWPAAELRPIGSIVVDRFDPDTWLQLVSMPRKMFFTVPSETLEIELDLFTAMQRPSRNSF